MTGHDDSAIVWAFCKRMREEKKGKKGKTRKGGFTSRPSDKCGLRTNR